LLPDYRGIVVADAHTVYDHLYGPQKATKAGCWSHTRKYFLDAVSIDPVLVREPFQLIQTLFLIERRMAQAPLAGGALRRLPGRLDGQGEVPARTRKAVDEDVVGLPGGD
jgi:transposase IS66 family protein